MMQCNDKQMIITSWELHWSIKLNCYVHLMIKFALALCRLDLRIHMVIYTHIPYLCVYVCVCVCVCVCVHIYIYIQLKLQLQCTRIWSATSWPPLHLWPLLSPGSIHLSLFSRALILTMKNSVHISWMLHVFNNV